MSTRGRAPAATVLVAAAMLAAAPAHAHEPTLKAAETEALGPEHAAEHAAERRAARRWARLPRAERVRIARRARAAAASIAVTSAADPPAQVGAWNPTLIPFSSFAINAVLLPTGKILFWDRAARHAGSPNPNDRDNTSRAYLWNPAKPGVPPRDVSPPPFDVDGDGDVENVPLFCSGQSLLPTGEVFVAGGTLAYPSVSSPAPADAVEFKGARFALTFDPWTKRWTRQPSMRHGRWYPGQVELADGRIAVLAGYNESGRHDANGLPFMNAELEVFTPAKERGGVGRWTYYPAGNLATGYYPHMLTMPTGEVLLAGPYAEDSAALDPDRLTAAGSAWTRLGSLGHYHNAGNLVLLPGSPSGSTRVAMIGGFERVTPTDDRSIRTVETLDFAHRGAGWLSGAGAPVPSLNVARSNGNAVSLPDGSIVVVGGAAGKLADAADPSDQNPGQNWTGGDQRLKRVELLEPGAGAWRLGPAQRKWRGYHSTALLLPDGRVLSAGDDFWGFTDAPSPWTRDDKAEIYSPPYLYAGARPRIKRAPASVAYRRTFRIATAKGARTAVLMAPSAVTHGNDMNQRRVALKVTSRRSRRLTVKAPRRPAVAPPGFYMLVVLDGDGTPSKARWIKLDPDPPRVTAKALHPRRGAPRLRMRLRSDERATVRVEVRGAGRARAHRTVRLPARAARTVSLALSAPLRRSAQLRVRLRARDAAGNTATRTVRVRLTR
jgi:hypothetical protein